MAIIENNIRMAHPTAATRRRVFVQNKMNLLLKIFWNSYKPYNYLQFTQIGNDLQTLLKDTSIVWLALG
jgi:hypothetical protein